MKTRIRVTVIYEYEANSEHWPVECRKGNPCDTPEQLFELEKNEIEKDNEYAGDIIHDAADMKSMTVEHIK